MLNKIVQSKRNYLETKKFYNQYLYANHWISFYDAMKKDGLSIIGEIKRASPSKGIIREDIDFEEVCGQYNQGVDAISVLTECDHFNGSEKDLMTVREKTNLPILRKDFIFDERQVLESKNIGADAILLIASILEEEKLKRLLRLTYKIGLDALVEVHNKEELDKALRVGANIIGINNRNLKNFTIDLNTTKKLQKYIPEGTIVISESGIKDPSDIKSIGKVNGILVGETFMKSRNILKTAQRLKYAD